jgi:hypothetical protein
LGKIFPTFLKELTLLKWINNVDSTDTPVMKIKSQKKTSPRKGRGFPFLKRSY